MKKLPFIFFVVMSLCLVTTPGYSAEPVILVFGDSLSAGYGLQPGEEWPALLKEKLKQEKLDYAVINDSISGETTQDGLARFKNSFDRNKPAIVILELGANDGLRGQPLQTMRDNLEWMINYSKSQNASVLLVKMEIPANYGKRYVTEFRDSFTQIANKTAISHTEFLLKGMAGKPDLFQLDGLHPRAEAQPLLLDVVWQSLKHLVLPQLKPL